MRDAYPKKSHYLKFEKINSRIKMKHMLTEEEWSISIPVARFIKSLDGKTDPYAMEYDLDFVEDILEFMKEELLFEENERKTEFSRGFTLFALWIPDIKIIHRVAGFFWNHLIMLLWFPVFILGMYIALTETYTHVYGDGWCFLAGSLSGICIGVIFHEISHGAAALNYGGNLFEMGVMIHFFMPGAYCIIDYDNVKDRFKRAQISAAGIECNMLLSGIFLCMLKLGWFDSSALLCASEINFLIAVFNLSLIEGMDGNSIFEELFGCDNFVSRAKALIFNKSYKNRLKSRGINGKATIAACYLICAMQLLLPLVLFMEAANVISLFI